MHIKPIEWKDDKIIMLDQRLLPTQEVYHSYEDYLEVARAIEHMVIRGAPAIGVAAAMGVALGATGIGVKNYDAFYKKILSICERLSQTRPTAVNLFWALDRMKKICERHQKEPVPEIVEALKKEALKIQREDIEANRSIGRHGSELLADNMSVLTHCNAGALATAGYGTALGIVYAAQEQGKRIHVFADETRPFLQGARLTAWELQKHGIEVTVICDNMAASLMRQGKVGAVLVGADRITANGDVINKIGTYGLAILARHHNIPMIAAAPLSTLDFNKASGDEVLIEERSPKEVTHIGGQPICPSHVTVWNPAFDCTPAALVSAIVSEKGIARPPFETSLAKWR